MTLPARFIDDGPLVELQRFAVVVHDDGEETAPDLVAAADVQDGAMIAFIPHVEDVTELVQPDGEDIMELHTTVFYLGLAEDFDVAQRMDLHDAIAELAMRQPTIVAEVFGFSIWNPLDNPVLVADVGGSDLEDAYDSIEELMADHEEDLPPLPDQHEPWRPHITLKYGVLTIPPDVLEKTGPITYDRIRLAFGGLATDYPLGGAIVAGGGIEPFHLPGQHDQRSHGRGGIGAHSSPEEARIAQKLNDGKKLDRSVPSELRTEQAIAGWTHAQYGAKDRVPDAPGDISDSVAHAINHDPDADTYGGVFARTVAAAPPDAPTLYRGQYHHGGAGRVPSVGDTYDIGATSFTRDHGVAEKFAFEGSTTSDQAIITRVKKGSRALRIDQHSGSYSWEKEHVALGRYRVTGRKDSVKTVKRGGKKVEIKVTELDVEQIDDFDGPASFDTHNRWPGWPGLPTDMGL